MTTPNFVGRRPGAEQENMITEASAHWSKVTNEAPIQSLTRVEDAAKQLVTLTGLLQGVYFAVFAFSNLREQIADRLLLLFVVSPVGLWLCSLLFATLVFVPRERYTADLDNQGTSEWHRVRDTYITVVHKKVTWLHWAHGFLVASFAMVFVLLIALSFMPAATTSRPTQVIIVTPTPSSIGTPKP